MSRAVTIHHALGDVIVKPEVKINQARLKKMLCATLDDYLREDSVPASVVHNEARERHGEYYLSPGHYLRLYRHRADLTQVQLAERAGMRQHHLSEMENNKRALGKVQARKLAEILACDYRKLL